jgi:prevent-host-death family protein
MQRVWQLQEAKNKLSEVVDQAVQHGPQVITRRGVQEAVVVSYAEYAQLKHAKVKLSEFFRRSPLAGLSLNRDKSPAREPVKL